MADGQISGQMDPVTEKKIYKGALIALSGAVAILLLLIVFGLGVDQAVLGGFVAWLVPTGVNAAKEFMAGS